MNSIFVIATNTFRELIRSRILYALLIFSSLMIGFSQILAGLTFAEQERISVSFSITGVQISACILAIFIGSSLIYKEIEKKTILTLLARPLSRFQFLLGKILGLISLIAFLELCIGLLLAGLFFSLSFKMGAHFVVSLYGIFLEALVLASIALFFSSFCTPYTVVACSIGYFLVGHWLNSLHFFAEKSESYLMTLIDSLSQWIFPNLEVFNWRYLMVYKDPIIWEIILKGSLYAFCWFGVFMILSALITERRDFN